MRSLNIVHRDIKPENIFVSKDFYNYYCFKLGDFGISKLYGQNQMMNSIVGTPIYMAPEYFEGNDLGYNEKVDIWSLGILMDEFLHGELYFFSKEIN